MLRSLEAERARIAQIDAQILDLGDAPAQMCAENAQLQERLESNKRPVLTLPNELVSEIFIHFLPAYPLCPPLFGIDSPTSLTHICREWRQIALATPQLWRAIQLYDHDNKQLYHVVNIWLDRSRSCLLSIHSETNYAWPELFSGFLPHRSRWEYLKLHCVQIPPAAATLPLLRHLELSGHGFDSFSFHDVPLLRSADLDCDFTENITLPWAQLTCLTLRDVSPFECLPILEQTFNLVRCELCLWPDEFPTTHLISTEILLPRLESLTFMNADSAPVTNFLVALVAPALRSLRIPERLLGSDPIGLLASFISKSGCRLQEVAVQPDNKVPEDSYRSAFPSILRFSFVDEL
ncbi:hypothetical protein B0H19DRAFT_1153133 [Mycena capillaripes]|nr:hypothetical protein B0H19DRAFT_1153133 [Mycena capillaripes]